MIGFEERGGEGDEGSAADWLCDTQELERLMSG